MYPSPWHRDARSGAALQQRAAKRRARTRLGRGLGAALVCVLAGAVLFGTSETVSGAIPRADQRDVSGIGRPGSCLRPYSDTSPWNRPLGVSPAYDVNSKARVAALGSGPLTSDPTQFTPPVYYADSATPRPRVKVSGWYSNVTRGGKRLVNRRGGKVRMPVPTGATPSAGDQQIIVVDLETGEEWGASGFTRGASGRLEVANVYRYNTRWDGAPPRSVTGGAFVNRGAGLPYLAGLIRPCEIAQARIDHALAFAYDGPTASFVRPASKSDGDSRKLADLPEGARLQLDPTLSDTDLGALGCVGACLVVAHALQRYGMYVVDGSGRPKIFAEFESTAAWGGQLDESTVSPIPLSAFRVLSLTQLVRVEGRRVRVRRARVRAGGTFEARLPITIGKKVARRRLAARCSAAVGDTFLVVTGSSVEVDRRSRTGVARCEWRIPRRSGGALVEGFVGVLHPKGGTQSDFELIAKPAVG